LKQATQFRAGSGAAVASIVLASFAFARVQYGPSWEVPVAASSFFFEALVLTTGLCAFAIWSYIRLRQVESIVRPIMAVLAAASLVVTSLAYIADPAQWPVVRPTLSAMAMRLPIPVSVLCIAIWIVAWLASRAQHEHNLG